VLVGVGLAGGEIADSSGGSITKPKFPATLPFPLLCWYIAPSSVEGTVLDETGTFLCGGGCRGDKELSGITGFCLLLLFSVVVDQATLDWSVTIWSADDMMGEVTEIGGTTVGIGDDVGDIAIPFG